MVSEHFDPRQQMVWSDSVGWYTPARTTNPCRSLAADRPYSSSASVRRPSPFRSITSSSGYGANREARPVRPSSLSGYGGGPYRQGLGVIGLGSSACKIPSRFQTESALEPHLPRQIPDSFDLRRRRGPAELALAVSGPDRREVKVPHSTPGKIPNPSSDLGKMKEWVVSYEEDAFDSSAVWRIASVTNYKANYKLGNLEMARSAEDLRRITLKGTQEKQCMGVPEGPEGNFNPPSTGYSVVPSGWGQNQLPLACLVSPKLNQLNPSHGPELERECPQYPRELRNQSQLQYQDIQWNLNSGNGSEAEEMGDGPGEYLVIVREPEEDNSKMFEAEDETKKENAEEKKGVNESGDDDKINKDDAGETIVHHNLYPPLINCLTEGDEVISAIGNPVGFDHILTAGVISGLNRDIFSKAGVTIENGAHFHMKLGTPLHNLEAQTLPKSLHCNFIRLTLEYFKYSSLDAYEISACKMNRTQVSLMWILDQLPEERTILVKLLYFCKYCADNEAINIWNKNHLKVEMGNVSSKHLVLALLVKDRGKGSHSDLKDINHSYLWEAWKKKYPESASDNSDKLLSLRIVLLELPQQDNSFDCGLFLLHYVELFLMDTPSSFNPLDVISCTPEDAEDSMISSAVSEKTTEVIEDPGLVGMSQIDSTTALSNTRTQVGGFSVGQVQKAEPLFSGAYEGPVTALALDSMRNYSGSWDMTVCIWGRAQMKFVQKFMNADLGWPLASHGNTVTSTAGRDAYLWDSGSGELTSLISNAYVGNTYSLAQTHLSDVLFTRGEDGAIRLFGVWDVFDGEDINPAATLVHHTSPVHSLAFEYPWLVSAYCDGRISLIELWKLLTPKSSSKYQFRVKSFGPSAIEPSQRTLHGFGCSFFSIDIGADGIEFGGENFFDPIPKKWTTKNTGPATCKGSFVQFYYEPIKLILKTCMTDQKDKLWSILRKLGVTLKTEEKELIGKALMKHVMQTWLPANNALLEMMMFHLPSPSKTQKYHVEKLYEGSLDDIYTIAIRNCEQEGKVAEQIRSAIEQSTPDYVKEKLQERLAKLYGGVVVLKIGVANESSADAPKSLYLESVALRNSIVLGFQFATNAGPLCDEPMWGLAFIVEPYIFADNSDVANQSDHDNIFSRQVITAVREACRAAVLQSNTRLVEVMYFCELTTPTEQLGSTYAVLSKKRARVLKEEMQEGTTLFTTHAYLPVAESFGFSNQLRSVTSGAASALLVFSHWEVSSEDPFFTPKTQEVDSCLIRAMKFFVFPVVRVAVQCNAVSDLPKLVESLKCLTKPDHMVLGTMEESGEHIIAGAGELHLEVCLKDLLKKLLGRLLILSKGHSLSFILKLLSHGSQMRILEDKYCAEGEGMSNLKKIEVRKNSAILKILKNNVSEQDKFSFLGWLRFHLTA